MSAPGRAPSGDVPLDQIAPAPQRDDAASWTRGDLWTAGLILLVAVALRLLHLQQISIHDPFFTIPSVDGAAYDAWAREIVAGDWIGEGVLFMGPLYPFFMAAVYAVFGPSIPVLKAIHVLLGGATCVLLFGLTRELFDRRVAALAGALAALHAMLIFYGGTVMVVNLQMVLVLGFVWTWIRAERRPAATRWAVCGLLLGLSVLARQTTLLLAPVVALSILFSGTAMPSPLRSSAAARPSLSRLAHAAIFGSIVVLLILPFTWRNYVAGDDFVLLNSSGGPNVFMGNQSEADGAWQPPNLGTGHRIDNPRAMQRVFTQFAERATGHEMKASEVSRYWLERGLEEIAADPGRWLRLELRKLALFFNATEIWNNRAYEISQRFSWVLRLPLVGFGILTPLGVVGIALSRRRWRSLIPLYATIGVYLASALVFFVLSRYRMPGAVLFIPFAAFAVVAIYDRLSARAFGAAGVAIGCALALALAVRAPIETGNRMHMAYYNLGNKYRELERWDEAIAAYTQSLEANPGAVSTHNNLAVTLEHAGRREEAIRAWRSVLSVATRIGNVERIERAERHLRDLGAAPTAP